MKLGSSLWGYPKSKSAGNKKGKRHNVSPQKEILAEKRVGKGWHPKM